MGIIIFIVVFVMEIIAGFEFGSIAEQKGHSKNKYALWSILFPIVGYFMVAALPDRGITKTISIENNIDTDELPTL